MSSGTLNPLSDRGLFPATVVANLPICREHFRLILEVEQDFPDTLPGQFIQLGCDDPIPHATGRPTDQDGPPLHLEQGRELEWNPCNGPPADADWLMPHALLRRPFSLAGQERTASGAVRLHIIHRVVGIGTDWLARLEAGRQLDLIGPLGNAFSMPAGRSLALLVGGGVGIPPMYYLADVWGLKGIEGVGFIGALTADLLAAEIMLPERPDQAAALAAGRPGPWVGEFASRRMDAVVTTDDGSLGLKGRITDGLVAWLQSADKAMIDRASVFCCGSTPMMRAVAELSERYGLPCQVCLEQAMACGMGTCQSCIVKLDPQDMEARPGIPHPRPPHGTTEAGRPWRYYLACTDGPVFDSRSVVW